MSLKLAITVGEPAGIGPDLIVALAQQAWPAQMVVFANGDMLKARAKLLNLPLQLLDITIQTSHCKALGNSIGLILRLIRR
jgi:4-hydroxythreonine-4-phosphate dehydrogenase